MFYYYHILLYMLLHIVVICSLNLIQLLVFPKRQSHEVIPEEQDWSLVLFLVFHLPKMMEFVIGKYKCNFDLVAQCPKFILKV